MTRETPLVAAGGFHHLPVMAAEVLRSLNLRPDAGVVDVTLGGAGHAQMMLAANAPHGRCVGIDRDADAIATARERLASFGDRVTVVQARMSEIQEVLCRLGISAVMGILADLGVSSFQLDCGSRGFSLRHDAPLDMRMDVTSGWSAAELIAQTDEEELARIIWEYGEERYSRRIARELVRRRPIATTQALVDAVMAALPPPARRSGRIHPATRTFQALRIAVNDELGELDRFLDVAPKVLNTGGRLVVISYHSLEDRRVKHAFRRLVAAGGFALPTRRSQVPTEEEIEQNPRARSAKLRVLERMESETK